MLLLNCDSPNQAKHRQNIWAKNNLIILLTMTIDPNNTIGAYQKDVPQRIATYRQSLTRWADLPYKVVVIESSGYGNPFEDILIKAPHISYYSIKLPHIPARGKGYGEAQILKYAMNELITDDQVNIMKITARYAPVDDLSPVLEILTAKSPEIIAKYNNSEWFVAKRDFYLELAENCIIACGYERGMTSFEAQLKKVALSNKAMFVEFMIPVIKTMNGRNGSVESI